MKNTRIIGILNELKQYIGSQLYSGYYQDFSEEYHTDAVSNKDTFDNMCLEFAKERLPKNFDISRISHLIIDIKKSKINIKISIDDKKFEI